MMALRNCVSQVLPSSGGPDDQYNHADEAEHDSRRPDVDTGIAQHV
jgi:hypothetical protein